MVEKFWKWMLNYAGDKVKELYLQKHHHDRLCSICNTWISQTSGPARFEEVDGLHADLTCKRCGGTTRWIENGIAPQCVGIVIGGTINPLDLLSLREDVHGKIKKIV